jgi:hypothetical protein
MQAIRVVAVGLLVAAGLMFCTAQSFFSFWHSSVAFDAWARALQALSEGVFKAGGADSVGISVFVSSCLGIGLLFSATFYVALESMIFGGGTDFRAVGFNKR